jgi:LPXTG-motif cell wall-anchored protein
MNQAAQMFITVFGILFAIVLIIIGLPYLSPYSGSASSGLASTGSVFNSELPFIGMILVGGAALLAMEGRRR